MSANGVPYGVPLPFGYDGDALYFVFLGASANLRKETYAEQSETASVTAIDVTPGGTWRHVIAAGPLNRITPEYWDDAREAMLDNAYRSELLAEHELRENPNVWALDIEARSGRAVGQSWGSNRHRTLLQIAPILRGMVSRENAVILGFGFVALLLGYGGLWLLDLSTESLIGILLLGGVVVPSLVNAYLNRKAESQ